MQILLCHPMRVEHLVPHHLACMPKIGKMLCANVGDKNVQCRYVLSVALCEAAVLKAHHLDSSLQSLED